MSTRTRKRVLLESISLLSLVAITFAHEGHHELSEEEQNAPVDVILWMHMVLQMLVWGVLFPVGMVLGMSRSRWHVPLQVSHYHRSCTLAQHECPITKSVGFALTAAGYVLAHTHKGRQFSHTFHGTFASFLYIPIILQLSLGIYLKLHIHEQSIRPYAVRAHGVVGKAYPILGWTQMLLGAITYGGYCKGSHLGQCLAHYIMVCQFFLVP